MTSSSQPCPLPTSDLTFFFRWYSGPGPCALADNLVSIVVESFVLVLVSFHSILNPIDSLRLIDVGHGLVLLFTLVSGLGFELGFSVLVELELGDD